jgi:hypothetical protein
MNGGLTDTVLDFEFSFEGLARGKLAMCLGIAITPITPEMKIKTPPEVLIRKYIININ